MYTQGTGVAQSLQRKNRVYAITKCVREIRSQRTVSSSLYKLDGAGVDKWCEIGGARLHLCPSGAVQCVVGAGCAARCALCALVAHAAVGIGGGRGAPGVAQCQAA